MISMPKVSVIIPTYNRCEFLKIAIESVLSQTFTDWELIVINDGSTDGTEEIVKGYCRSDSRIRYVYQSNQGAPKARQKSVYLARGQYLAFLDDDDCYFPEKLQKQVYFLQHNQKAGLVYSYVEMVNQNNQMFMLWPYKPAFNFMDLIEESMILTNSVLVRRQCFERVGSFNGRMTSSDDYEMWLRIARVFEIAFLPERVGTYRWHQGNVSHNWKLHSKSRVDIYKDLLKKGLYFEEEGKVIQSALRVTYVKAVDALDAKQYAKAAFYYWMAVYFDPLIGLIVPWTKFKNRLYRLLKPYFAMGYCSLMSMISKEKPCAA